MPPRDFQSRLARRAARVGLLPADELLDRLDRFYALLSRWNEKINLTSLSDPDEAVDRLFLEPLLAARYIAPSAATLLDIGSGGGSPAIPMALAVPALALTMVESKARKSAFLREAIRQLGLNAQVENSRLEDLLTRPALHEKHDVVSMRAVRVEAKMLVTAQAFLKPGGQMMMFRGSSGPHAPLVVPPLEFVETQPLVDTLQSRVTMLVKRSIGSPPATTR